MKGYDAVVIGGGVIGISVVYYLSKKGIKVALVEKGDIASGTSSRCDGNVLIADKQPGFDTKMTYDSQLLFKELVKEIPYDFDYTQRGSIYIIESEEEFKIAKEYVKKQVEDGYPMRMMDKSEIHDDEPYLAEDIIGGVEIGCDASVNPMALVFGLSLEAKKNGAEIFDYTYVKDIRLDKKGAVEAVETDQGMLITKCVVNCAGVWAPEIGNMVGIDIPIKPRQGQLLVAEKTFPVGKRKIVEFGYMMAKFGDENYKRNVSPELEKFGIAFVFEPTLSDNFLIGSSRAFVGFDTDVSIEVMQGLAERAIRFFPVMKDIHVIRAYAGLRPYVDDHMPIISKVDEVPGFYIAAGHEGDGIGLSPLTGKLISQMVTGEETILPIDTLSINRFKE
ncbi:MAG: FAD-dependent oxidoreductase [Actinomycetota bacterium]|nr:FAD-dependent oxidoreductase [Actinomycetota bacterium]